MENDVAQEIVDDLTSKIKTEIQNLKLERSENSEQVITTKLYSFLSDLFLSTNNKTDIIQSILEKENPKQDHTLLSSLVSMGQERLLPLQNSVNC